MTAESTPPDHAPRMPRLTAAELRAILATAEFSPDDLRDARGLVKDTVQYFDFGDGEAPRTDTDLVADLWREKLLRPPFDQCVFMFRHHGRRVYLLAGYGVNVVTAPDEEYSGATVLITVSQYGKLTRAECLSWFVSVDGPGHEIMAGGIPLCECEGETAESFRRFSLWTVGKFMRLCMALNTKGIRQRHEPVPVKLNKKRARSGKPPLSAVTYVDLSAHAPSGHGGSGKGGEKSTHLRRGHIRHYDDGSVTWVRDCIVKADGDLKIRERYRVLNEKA